MDRAGRLYATWYTEGAKEEPSLLFATSTDGQYFTPPTRLDQATASIPDHPRMEEQFPVIKTVVQPVRLDEKH